MEKHVMQYQTVHFNLNGKDVERTVDVRASLTDMLRNDYHLTSVKKGCEVGECGACTVLIDGETFNSCIYLAVWADGKHIRTLESLMGPDGELSDIQQADMLIIGGTSLVVYPAAGLVNYYQGHRLVLINKSTTPYDKNADLVLYGPIGEILDQIKV